MRTTIGLDKLNVILRSAAKLDDVPGYFAECGVFEGFTIKALSIAFPDRKVLGFDTFSGLPREFWQEDEIHHPGEFAAESLDQVRADLQDAPNVTLVPGLFPMSAEQFANERFAFVHLEFDFYRSTRMALDWLLTHIADGGVIVLDDYDWPHCPGVRRAVDETGIDVFVAGYQAIYIHRSAS